MDKVSIIIPCREIDKLTKRCIEYCEKLPEEKEILVIPDSVCAGFPSVKRNYAMKIATGNIYAFIDSDAYPSMDWLTNALYYLKTHSAVCGPGILPFDASIWEQAADIAFQRMPYKYRVIPGNPNIVPEFPTFNLVVKKEVATEFENYLTGEDTLFCRKIKEGIYYHPSIMVYHNRRPLFKKAWKQVGTYGKHRGYLIVLSLIGFITMSVVYMFNFMIGMYKALLRRRT